MPSPVCRREATLCQVHSFHGRCLLAMHAASQLLDRGNFKPFCRCAFLRISFCSGTFRLSIRGLSVPVPTDCMQFVPGKRSACACSCPDACQLKKCSASDFRSFFKYPCVQFLQSWQLSPCFLYHQKCTTCCHLSAVVRKAKRLLYPLPSYTLNRSLSVRF